MPKPRPPEGGDDLADLYAAGVLPPAPKEPPSTYRKRWPSWTADGVAALTTPGVTADAAARRDDQVQDQWEAEHAAEREAAEESRALARERAARQRRDEERRDRESLEAAERQRRAEERAEQEAADDAERRRLTLVEQRLRVDDRLRRRRKRKDDAGEDQK